MSRDFAGSPGRDFLPSPNRDRIAQAIDGGAISLRTMRLGGFEGCLRLGGVSPTDSALTANIYRTIRVSGATFGFNNNGTREQTWDLGDWVAANVFGGESIDPLPLPQLSSDNTIGTWHTPSSFLTITVTAHSRTSRTVHFANGGSGIDLTVTLEDPVQPPDYLGPLLNLCSSLNDFPGFDFNHVPPLFKERHYLARGSNAILGPESDETDSQTFLRPSMWFHGIGFSGTIKLCDISSASLLVPYHAIAARKISAQTGVADVCSGLAVYSSAEFPSSWLRELDCDPSLVLPNGVLEPEMYQTLLDWYNQHISEVIPDAGSSYAVFRHAFPANRQAWDQDPGPMPSCFVLS